MTEKFLSLSLLLTDTCRYRAPANIRPENLQRLHSTRRFSRPHRPSHLFRLQNRYDRYDICWVLFKLFLLLFQSKKNALSVYLFLPNQRIPPVTDPHQLHQQRTQTNRPHPLLLHLLLLRPRSPNWVEVSFLPSLISKSPFARKKPRRWSRWWHPRRRPRRHRRHPAPRPRIFA